MNKATKIKLKWQNFRHRIPRLDPAKNDRVLSHVSQILYKPDGVRIRDLTIIKEKEQNILLRYHRG
jgi:hypothetical protein